MGFWYGAWVPGGVVACEWGYQEVKECKVAAVPMKVVQAYN